MDKSEGKDWFSKTLNSFTEETAKVYKISRLKLEIGTTNKTKHEKMNHMSRKLIALIKDGKIDANLFEPEYSAIISLENDIKEKEEEISAIKSNLKINNRNRKQDIDDEETVKENTQKETDKTE